jgi:hypothetical protein
LHSQFDGRLQLAAENSRRFDITNSTLDDDKMHRGPAKAENIHRERSSGLA